MHASSPQHRWPILVPTLQSIYSSSLMVKIFCIKNRKLEQVVFSLQSEQPNSPPIIGFPSETFRYVTAPRDWTARFSFVDLSPTPNAVATETVPCCCYFSIDSYLNLSLLLLQLYRSICWLSQCISYVTTVDIQRYAPSSSAPPSSSSSLCQREDDPTTTEAASADHRREGSAHISIIIIQHRDRDSDG